MAGAEDFLGQRLEGTLNSWKSPWGWVSCPRLGSDLFVHSEDLISGVLTKGATISFEVGADPKSGKHRARKIEVTGLEMGEGDAAGALDGEGRVDGVVARWKEPWGWFSCPAEEKEVFAHREDVIGGDPYVPLETGQACTFIVGTDPKSGRRRALRIAVAVQGERLQGKIASWKEQWGWISCKQLEAEGDIFAHKEDFCSGRTGEPGMLCTFEVGVDAKGRRRAKKIAVAGGGGGAMGKGACVSYGTGAGCKGGYGCKGDFGKGAYGCKGDFGCKGGYGFKGGYGMGMGMMPMMYKGGKGCWKGGPPSPQQFVGQQLNGIVSSWKDQWGWISSPLMVGDVFAHSEDLDSGKQLSVGEHVVFTVGYDAKGRVRAKQIHGGNMPGKKRKKGGDDSERKGFEGHEGEVLEGEVASWKSPWGWIKCQEYQGDLFAHKEDIATGEDLAVGQPVTFTVGRDEKSGRWRAVEITALGPSPKQMRTM